MEKNEVKLSDVKKMIAEEYANMKKKLAVKGRINQINEELENMEQEEKVNEVEADGTEKVRSSAWTGKPNGDEKFKPKFEKKGSSLLEDEEEEMGEFEAKLAELGRAFDAKFSTGGAATSDDNFDSVTIEDKPEEKEGGVEDSITVDDDTTNKEGGEKEGEIEEYNEVNPSTQSSQGQWTHGEKEKEMKESVTEPLEGNSVAQETKQDSVNDNMKKDTHVKESKQTDKKVVTEATTKKTAVLTEGLEKKQVQALNEELNRMRKLAKLSNDEE